MQFYLDIHSIHDYHRNLNEVPRHFGRFIIPFTYGKFYRWEAGMLLLQSLPHAGPLHFYHFHIQQPSRLHPQAARRERILFLYVKKGNLKGSHATLGEQDLNEGYYYLFCVPYGARNEVIMQPGMYQIVQLNISKEELFKIKLTDFQKERLDQYLRDPERYGYCMFRSAIGPFLRASIRQAWQKAPRNELEAVLFLKEQGNRLMTSFLDDFILMYSDYAAIRHEQLLEMILYMKANLRNPNIIGNTARKFNLSDSTLLRIFKSGTGKSPIRYLSDYRMQQAKSMLQDLDTPLKVIADELGYKDYNCFYMACKKTFNYSPRALRNRLNFDG